MPELDRLMSHVAGDGLCGGLTPCYATIAEAYQESANDQLIKIGGGFYEADLWLNKSQPVTLLGGLECRLLCNRRGGDYDWWLLDD